MREGKITLGAYTATVKGTMDLLDKIEEHGSVPSIMVQLAGGDIRQIKLGMIVRIVTPALKSVGVEVDEYEVLDAATANPMEAIYATMQVLQLYMKPGPEDPIAGTDQGEA